MLTHCLFHIFSWVRVRMKAQIRDYGKNKSSKVFLRIFLLRCISHIFVFCKKWTDLVEAIQILFAWVLREHSPKGKALWVRTFLICVTYLYFQRYAVSQTKIILKIFMHDSCWVKLAIFWKNVVLKLSLSCSN